MTSNATRLTLYALLTAIEVDLRDAIVRHLGANRELDQLLGGDLFSKVFSRFQRDQGVTAYAVAIGDLVTYLDFDDTFHVLGANRTALDASTAEAVKEAAPQFQRLSPIRNRVMHGRPLEFDDLSTTLDLTDYLLSLSTLSQWTGLKRTLEHIKNNPASVLGLSIPFIHDGEISHNLPIPDFDETGFVGRKTLEGQLEMLIRGPYPVISVIGEGGIGKTALVLKVAYSLLDSGDSPFDAIVWSTAKASQITAQEIVRIKGAITDSLGMLQSIREQVSSTGDEDPIAEIIAYLKEFRLLLILDNLETVKDARIMSFLDRLPAGSKVLITSRIGLGEYERRLAVDPLTEADAVRLLRALLKTRNLSAVDTKNGNGLASFCKRMKNNPGYIKWFVSALQAGQRPEAILQNSALFLDYCMSNVYEFLAADSKTLVEILQCIPMQLSQAELAYLSEFSVQRLQVALQQLMTTNMLRLGSSGVGIAAETRYSLSELAREYLMKHHPISSTLYQQLRNLYQEVVHAEQRISQEERANPFSYYSIVMRSKGEVLTGKYLLDALKFAQKHDITRALECVERARALSPQYYEVHRVAAYVNVVAGNIPTAEECYEAALELEPRSAPLRYWYGNFLVRYAQDPERAFAQYKAAEELAPGEPQIALENARAICSMGRFREAESIVESLLARARLPAAVLRKVYDLRMQCYLREAIALARFKDIDRAYETLRRLKTIIDEIPYGGRDNYVVSTIKRSCGALTHVAKIIGDQHRKNELLSWRQSLIDSLAELGITYEVDRAILGEIRNVQQNYGFILGEDGKQYFFHFRSVRFTLQPGEPIVGKAVRFELGANATGVCAINVQFADDEISSDSAAHIGGAD